MPSNHVKVAKAQHSAKLQSGIRMLFIASKMAGRETRDKDRTMRSNVMPAGFCRNLERTELGRSQQATAYSSTAEQVVTHPKIQACFPLAVNLAVIDCQRGPRALQQGDWRCRIRFEEFRCLCVRLCGSLFLGTQPRARRLGQWYGSGANTRRKATRAHIYSWRCLVV